MWKERKEKRWEDINILKVVEVRSLNLDLDLLWKDLGVKLGEIIKDYKTFLLSNFQKKKDMFCESYEPLKTMCQIWFFGDISFN